MLVLLLVAGMLWLAALVRKTRRDAHGRRYRLGLRAWFRKLAGHVDYRHYGHVLLFCAGLGDVIMGVVKLAWGGAPPENPGVMYWSWPVIQIVCVAVVWAWSRVFTRLIEVATLRGIAVAAT